MTKLYERISIVLSPSEMILLKNIASMESRRPQDQARYFVVMGLKHSMNQQEQENMLDKDTKKDDSEGTTY